jgi:putative Mg2+ transporter-C (MgtC) family protein
MGSGNCYQPLKHVYLLNRGNRDVFSWRCRHHDSLGDLARRAGDCGDLSHPNHSADFTGLVLAGNTLLRPLVNQINRAPMNEQTTEAIYEVRLATHPDNLNEARELLTARLQDANYPIREIEVIERDEETIEVVASLLGTSANREELDAVVTALDGAEITRHASWAARTLE